MPARIRTTSDGEGSVVLYLGTVELGENREIKLDLDDALALNNNLARSIFTATQQAHDNGLAVSQEAD